MHIYKGKETAFMEELFAIMGQYTIDFCACICFLMFVIFGKMTSKKTSIWFLCATISICLFIIFEPIEKWLGDLPRDIPNLSTVVIWRTICSVVCYSTRPAVAYFIVLVAIRERKKKTKIILSIPLIANFLIYLTMFFSDIAVSLEGNSFARGPLGWTAFVVSGLYLAILFVFGILRLKKGEYQEFFICTMIVVFCIVAITLETKFMTAGLLPTACIIGEVFYYIIFLSTAFIRDPLTNAYIRIRFYTDIKKRGPKYLIMFDINEFKAINDKRGHAVGDKMLRYFADSAKECLSYRAEIYRLGGDEFAIIYNRATEEEVIALLDKIKEKAHELPYGYSYGYAEFHDEQSFQDAYAVSDSMLYRNKAENKKKVVLEGDQILKENVIKDSVASYLFNKHLEGVVIVDVKTQQLVPIGDALTGSMGKWIDHEDLSYEHNSEFVVGRVTAIENPDEFRKRIALETVEKHLNLLGVYTVEFEMKGEKESKYKRMSFHYYGKKKEYMMLALEDITESVSGEIDPLTGIYDSTGFHKHVTEWIQNHPGEKYRVQRYNIDKFRIINGLYGYSAGDQLLRDFGQFMKRSDDENSFSAHLNADHFVRFCVADKCPPVEYYVDECHRVFADYDLGLPITVHMGIYDLCEEDCNSFNMNYKALLALQEVKGKANKTYSYYKKGLMDEEITQQELLADFDNALKNGEFDVWFQPQVNYKTGEIVCAEALTRWHHPKRGLLTPGQFLPILEQSGRIIDMDKAMIQKSCDYLKKWKKKFPSADIRISGNLSRSYILDPSLPQMIKDLVEKNGINPQDIHFEITETAYVKNAKEFAPLVHMMREHGLMVEMDDFGSEYSSLNALKDIEFDVIKLDMRFLSGDSKRSRTIIRSIIKMIKDLDIEVIAEGIETKEQADMLLKCGCELMQGYYFSKPIPAKEYEKMLKEKSGGVPQKDKIEKK